MFKKRLLVLCTAVCAVFSTVSVTAAEQTPSPVSAPAPMRVADQTVFQGTLKYLDQNGLSLDYRNANFVKDLVGELIQATKAQPALNKNPEIHFIWDILTHLWYESGIDAIQSSGSSISRDGSNYVIRSFCYAPQQMRTGFIWQLCPQSPTLPFIDVMPANTSMAFALNLNGRVIWDAINSNVRKYAPPEGIKDFDEMLADAKKDGVDLPALISGFNGFGFYAVCDLKTIQNAHNPDAKPLDAAFIVSVKDAGVFKQILDAVKKDNPKSVVNNEIRIPIPIGMITVFQVGNYIVAATDPAGIKARLAAPGKGLVQSPAFKAVSKDFPQTGYSWGYVAPDFLSTFANFGAMFIPAETGINVLPYIKLMGLDTASFFVSGMNPDGAYAYMRTGSRPLTVLCGYPEVSAVISSIFNAAVLNNCTSPSVKSDAIGIEEIEEFEEED